MLVKFYLNIFFYFLREHFIAMLQYQFLFFILFKYIETEILAFKDIIYSYYEFQFYKMLKQTKTIIAYLSTVPTNIQAKSTLIKIDNR